MVISITLILCIPTKRGCLYILFLSCQVFGKPLVACLLSNQWPVRETALNRLAQDVVAMLLRGNANDGLSVETIVRTCCLIVTHCCSDPVFKVYVAALVRKVEVSAFYEKGGLNGRTYCTPY